MKIRQRHSLMAFFIFLAVTGTVSGFTNSKVPTEENSIVNISPAHQTLSQDSSVTLVTELQNTTNHSNYFILRIWSPSNHQLRMKIQGGDRFLLLDGNYSWQEDYELRSDSSKRIRIAIEDKSRAGHHSIHAQVLFFGKSGRWGENETDVAELRIRPCAPPCRLNVIIHHFVWWMERNVDLVGVGIAILAILFSIIGYGKIRSFLTGETQNSTDVERRS